MLVEHFITECAGLEEVRERFGVIREDALEETLLFSESERKQKRGWRTGDEHHVAPSEIVFQEQSYSGLHSGRSLAWDHVCGDIGDTYSGDFCGVIPNF